MKAQINRDVYYLAGYAYGYSRLNIRDGLSLADFREGYNDGQGDKDANELPVVDFNCTHFIGQEIGTMITGIRNPFTKNIHEKTHIYTLGDFPELGEVYVSVPVNYANSDRQWELRHNH